MSIYANGHVQYLVTINFSPCENELLPVVAGWGRKVCYGMCDRGAFYHLQTAPLQL